MITFRLHSISTLNRRIYDKKYARKMSETNFATAEIEKN